jgi:hypothetical protein
MNTKKVSLDIAKKERDNSFGKNINVSNQFKNNPGSNRYR